MGRAERLFHEALDGALGSARPCSGDTVSNCNWLTYSDSVAGLPESLEWSSGCPWRAGRGSIRPAGSGGFGQSDRTHLRSLFVARQVSECRGGNACCHLDLAEEANTIAETAAATANLGNGLSRAVRSMTTRCDTTGAISNSKNSWTILRAFT